MANKRRPFNAVLNLTLADTEYSYTFPPDTVAFALKPRKSHRIKLSWQSGESGSVYFTTGPGAACMEEGIYNAGGAPLIIYAQCDVAAEVLEIIGWRQ